MWKWDICCKLSPHIVSLGQKLFARHRKLENAEKPRSIMYWVTWNSCCKMTTTWIFHACNMARVVCLLSTITGQCLHAQFHCGRELFLYNTASFWKMCFSCFTTIIFPWRVQRFATNRSFLKEMFAVQLWKQKVPSWSKVEVQQFPEKAVFFATTWDVLPFLCVKKQTFLCELFKWSCKFWIWERLAFFTKCFCNQNIFDNEKQSLVAMNKSKGKNWSCLLQNGSFLFCVTKCCEETEDDRYLQKTLPEDTQS